MAQDANIPKDNAFDSTLALLKEGYGFIPERRRRLGSDVFRTRLMLRPFTIITGPGAADVFYDKNNFERAGTLPKRVQRTLMGEGGVQTLDGQEHQHRKQMFMALMGPEALERYTGILCGILAACGARWPDAATVNLFEESKAFLMEAVCAWAGVPIASNELRSRAEDMWLMVDGFGGVGRRYRKGRSARKRSEEWIGGLVEAARIGTRPLPGGSAAESVAFHRDPKGNLLDRHTAAVEILNILRPTVANAVYVAYIAGALHDYPDERERLQADPGRIEPFVQEVRRFYPFTPFIGAKARRDFGWNGHAFHKGEMVILDIYGLCRDARIFDKPDIFDPGRFEAFGITPYNFIPQGGGMHLFNHRCAGEWITTATMRAATDFLVNAIDYHLADGQNLDYPLRRIPTWPRSGVEVKGVQIRNTQSLEPFPPKSPSHRSGSPSPR